MLVKLSIILFSNSHNSAHYAQRFYTYYSQNYAWLNTVKTSVYSLHTCHVNITQTYVYTPGVALTQLIFV